MNNNVYDVIIVGGGPAGVAAGIYASRKRLSSLLLTKEIGGQSLNSGSIENFIGFEKLSGMEFSEVLQNHLRAQDHITVETGVEVVSVSEEDNCVVVVDGQGKEYRSKYLLLALGSQYKRLETPGEREFEGKGVFYCSICDAPLMKDKDVVVIGGGNSAFEAIIDLLPYAKNIHVFQRSGVLRADAVYQERIAKHENVHIHLNREVKTFEGEAFLSGVTWKDTLTEEEGELPVAGAFVAIGYIPNTSLVSDLVDLTEKNTIKVDRKTFQTSHPRIWAAGDITDELYHQINTAMGDGVNAILNIYDKVKMEDV